MKAIILFLIILFFVGCKQEKINYEVVNISSYPVEAVLSGESIIVEEAVKFPLGCCLVDSFLILFDDKSDHFLNIYSSGNKKLIANFGKIGNGPNEFNVPNENSLKIVEYKNRLGLWLQDAKYLTFLDIDSIISNRLYSPHNKIAILPELIPTNVLFYINDTLLIGNSSIPGVQYYNWNPKKDTFSYINFYPKGDFNFENIPNQYYSTIFNGTMDHNYNQLVCAYIYFGLIDIIDINTQCHIKRIALSTKTKTGIKVSNGNVDVSDNDVYCTDIKILKNAIYALYWGDNEYNMMEKPDFFPSLLVIKTDGTPLARFKLDKKFFKFCISPDGKTLFGITPLEDPTSPFVKYILPEY